MDRRLVMESVSQLIPPPKWKETLDENLVRQLAESMALEGLQEPIVVVRAAGKHYIQCGVHRWRAAIKAGIRTIECVVSPQSKSAEEVEAKVIAENLVRKVLRGDERSQAIARMIEIRKTRYTADGQQTIPPAGGGSLDGRKTVESQVRKGVARDLGITEKAVARAQEKARPAQLPANLASNSEPELGDAAGNPIPPDLVDTRKYFAAYHDGMAKLCTQLLGDLTRWEKESYEFDRPVVSLVHDQYRRWYQIAKSLGHEIRNSKPDMVCPWCGGLDGCDTCREVGLVTAELAKKETSQSTLDAV